MIGLCYNDIPRGGERMATEAQKRAVAKYDKEHTTFVIMKLNLKTDADILKRLSEVDSKQGYIKRLIRQDMERTV